MEGIRDPELVRLSVPVAPHVRRPLPSFTDVRGEVNASLSASAAENGPLPLPLSPLSLRVPIKLKLGMKNEFLL